MNIASHGINHSNCHALLRFSKVNFRGKDCIWKSYDTIHLYEELSTINPVFLELIEKMENWGEDWIWHVGIYSTCWINCQNLFRFSRIFTFNERLPSGEVNNFSWYIAGSPAQSRGLFDKYHWVWGDYFAGKENVAFPIKYQFISLQVLVLCFTTVMFWLLKRVQCKRSPWWLGMNYYRLIPTYCLFTCGTNGELDMISRVT